MIIVKQFGSLPHHGRGAVTSLGLLVDSHTEVNVGRDAVITASRRRYATKTETVDEKSTPGGTALKPFSEIPGPKGLPIIGTLWDYVKADGFKANKVFEVRQIRANEYGPIFKETIMNQTSVTITDLDEYAKVIKVDGKFPIRYELLPLAHYLKKRNMSLGLLNSQGEEWYKLRKILIRKMLTLNEVQQYIDAHDRVATDFVTRLRHLQAMSHDHVVQDLENEVFKWALESIGYVLFDERIGCLVDPVPPLAQEFVVNVSMYFKYMYQLLCGMPTYKLYPTKTWKIFEQHADRVFAIGQTFVNKKLEALQKQKTHGLEKGENEDKSAFLTYLLSQADLTPQEVNLACIELLNGGVETTSRGLLWILYCLAKNPDIQEMVFRETENVLPGRAAVTADSLQKLQYLRACQKETFRLYPVAFSTNRRIAKDIECFGYHIPAGTSCDTNLYAIGRDDRFFPDAERFQPERWLRGDREESRLKTLSSLVFGHGPRMCIGRRFAEQEIYISLAKIIQNFRLEYHEEDVEPVFYMAMTTDRPLKITFIPRN